MTSKTVSPTAEERINALMELHPKGYDLSLGRITGLLEKLGNPQDKLPPVMHFAGTNGKGSTIAFCRAILEAAGQSVHVHTSPHLVNWHERYRMGQKGTPGRLVDDAVLSSAIARVADANDGQQITVFEVLTVVTFILFSEHPADVCLIEVGLGGRFDATNVMKETAVSVISPVSIDHEAFLGNTLAKIAFEKAGIIKQKTPVAIGNQEPEALEVIERQAAKNLARRSVYGQDFTAEMQHGRFLYQDETSAFDCNPPALPGQHQCENAALAIAALQLIKDDLPIELTNDIVNEGLGRVEWPARMQRLPQGSLTKRVEPNTDIWIDGGHNPGAAAQVRSHLITLHEKAPAPVFIICGMLETKDAGGYFAPFKGLVEQVITVPITTSDAGIEAGKLARIAGTAGLSASSAKTLEEALDLIPLDRHPRILFCGSLYLAGDVLAQNGTHPR